MMKKLVGVFIVIFIYMLSFGQEKADYDDALDKFRVFYNQSQPDSIFSMFSDRIKDIMTLNKTIQSFNQLHIFYGDVLSFEPQDTSKGFYMYKTEFTKATLTLIVSLNKELKFEALRFVPDKDAKSDTIKTNFEYESQTGKIKGILTMPQTDKKIPVVLIIAGSGPTDKNGNSHLGVKANEYKLIADSLYNAGIACLRYDKRGVGESSAAMKDQENLSFDDYVSDAVGLIKKLNEDNRFSKVIVLGHSEGSLIGMIAAQKAKTDKFISLAGAGDRVDVIITKQLSVSAKELGTKAKPIFDSLLNGYKVKKIDSELITVFQPAIQNYLISWLHYNPQTEIKKLKIPILILQGSTDIQVSVDDAEKLHVANGKSTLKIITGMNHILKKAPQNRIENLATYSKPTLPLATILMTEIIKFIEQ